MKYYVVNRNRHYNYESEAIVLGIYSSLESAIERIKLTIQNINGNDLSDIVFDLDNTNDSDYIGYIRVKDTILPDSYDIWCLEVDAN